jgi:23S rRNA (adenine2503-C2)-methyltransferase
MCDAGRSYNGNLEAGEIHAQIDFLLETWAGGDADSCRKLKIQFARMGEPALNPAVLTVIGDLPSRHPLPGLMPCVSSTAPSSSVDWFGRLGDLKDSLFQGGMFQIQMSVQSTSERERRRLIPFEILGLDGLSGLCDRLVKPGDRKVSLNFAAVEGVPIDPCVLRDAFDPGRCLVKLTPLNDTGRAGEHGFKSLFHSEGEGRVRDLEASLREAGFEVIVSVGLPVEGESGTSCGQLAFFPRTAPGDASRHVPVEGIRVRRSGAGTPRG